MIVEKVIWTALPAGLDRETRRLRLSVHVAPRLTTDDGDPALRTLGEYPAFEHWPDRLGNIRFRVEFDNGVVAEGTPLEAASPDLWKIVFPPKTTVRPHAFQDHAKRNLHVFPVRDVLQFVKQTYGDLAAAGPNLPSIDDPTGLLAAFDPLVGLTDQIGDASSFWEELNRAHEQDKEDGRVVHESVAGSSQPGAQVTNALFEAYRFYHRPGSQRPDFPKDYVEKPPDPPEFDFHEIATLLADYPVLLRRLGLVIDLVVELDDPHGNLPATGTVRVVPDGELPEDPPRSPETRYDLDGEWFGARPQQTIRMERGLVRLTPEFWDLLQVDVDGAALQAVGFADTLERFRDPERRNQDTPGDAGAPALHSAGFALARQGRGDVLLGDLKGRRSKNTNVETSHPVILDAEDLVRGYRVDVFDEDAPAGARWFSLHDRTTVHTVGNPALGVATDELDPIRDEGYIKATGASSERKDHPTPSDDLYLHETVVAWDGWSLSAPRPGKRIVEPGEGDNGGPIARHQPADGQAGPVVSVVGVANGTLPRLRMGHTYRLRMRTVDLAGNSRPFEEADLEPQEDHLTSEPELFVRFEPVPSPAVLRRHLDTEGESLEHLVIRSNLGVTSADYAASNEVKAALAEAGAAHAYAADSQRHLAAPKGSQQMAEQDSRFDAAFGGTPAQMTTALRLALREEGTFLDPAIVDPATGQKTIIQSPIALHPPGTPMPPQRGAGLPDGAYARYPDPAVVLPYLPDPLAVGISITGYDFTGAEVFHTVALYPGDWPDRAPFRVVLTEGPTKVEFGDGVLGVRLPKAEVIRARLSSVFPTDRLSDFAIWHWTPQAAQTPDLKQAVIEGRHWVFTPWRIMTFTHAVQQPLLVPDMTKVTASRDLGSTFAEFRGPIVGHGKSTGRHDVFGEWTEDVDLITEDAPRMQALGTEVQHSAHAFGFDITPGEDAAEATNPGVGRVSRHEFGDTKYRRIVYHSVATTRFREFLPRPIADDPARIQRVEATDVEGVAKPALIHHIPSSARPAAPDVVYVLPTFRWEREDEGPIRTHVRHGNAVRVWLRRPWFSSGDGEQLGVILKPGIRLPDRWGRHPFVEMPVREMARRTPFLSAAPLRVPGTGARVRAPRTGSRRSSALGAIVSAELFGGVGGLLGGTARKPPSAEEIARLLRPYVTDWGSDPVWRSRLPDRPPTVAAFSRHVSYASGLTLEEIAPEARVVVAGHEVLFDGDRGLWYCDIEIDAGDSYYPFVRLALARYQPHSVTDAHLSRVTMSDFIQLAPDRVAELQRGRAGTTITVRGYAGRNVLGDLIPPALQPFVEQDENRPNTTMRAVVERRPAGSTTDLAWEPLGPEVKLSATASGFHVTWTGALPVPDGGVEGSELRVLVTEIETFPRDLVPSDPLVSTSPLDFVRERVVYADVFDL